MRTTFRCLQMKGDTPQGTSQSPAAVSVARVAAPEGPGGNAPRWAQRGVSASAPAVPPPRSAPGAGSVCRRLLERTRRALTILLRGVHARRLCGNIVFEFPICPGFLMTAYAFLQETPPPSADEVRETISGDICRCTGYAPIVQAIVSASRA